MSLLRALLLAILLMPAASALSVQVPAQVWSDDVAFVVRDLDADATRVNVTIGSGADAVHSVDVTSDHVFVLAQGLAAGEQSWTLQVWNATGVNHTVTGSVYVDDVLGGLPDLSGLADDLARLRKEVSALNISVEADGDVQVDLSSVLSRLSALQANLTTQSEPLQTIPTGQASTNSPVGTIITSVLLIGTMVLVGLLQWQSHRRHHEQMVLVLAMAAKLQVGPDSPEFRTASAALEG